MSRTTRGDEQSWRRLVAVEADLGIYKKINNR
jgi:hypothetical protein